MEKQTYHESFESTEHHPSLIILSKLVAPDLF